jgi:hypothetical protein
VKGQPNLQMPLGVCSAKQKTHGIDRGNLTEAQRRSNTIIKFRHRQWKKKQ